MNESDCPWRPERYIPTTPVLAYIAGYLGLISFLCIPAPFALLSGILALRKLLRENNTYGQGRAIFGIIMGAVCSLFYAVIAYMILTEKVSLFAPP
jgi:hypothetical protein